MRKTTNFNLRKGNRLKGKVTLVTGAGSGIGKGCALMFARQGATVIATDINQESLLQTQLDAADEKLKIHIMGPINLLNEVEVNGMLIRLINQHKKLDVIVNAAATAVFKWIEQLSYADWQHTLAAEIDSVFLVCRAAWPYLKQSGVGSIINFSSANAYVALQGSPALAHCAGKGAVLAMTRQLAMEGGPFGLRANTIAPGMIVTGATKSVLEQPGFIDNVMAKNMLKRLGQPEDIAWCAVYLASDESSYVTGSDFAVDAGAKAW